MFSKKSKIIKMSIVTITYQCGNKFFLVKYTYKLFYIM